MDCLARREHGERELARKLATRGYEGAVVATTLAALRADGLLSDVRFTDAFVHSRCQRGSGPQKIRAELRQRGIDEALIEASIAAREPQWEALVRQVREKKFGSALPADFRERGRQMRFLQQRGFTLEQIHSLFRETD